MRACTTRLKYSTPFRYSSAASKTCIVARGSKTCSPRGDFTRRPSWRWRISNKCAWRARELGSRQETEPKRLGGGAFEA